MVDNKISILDEKHVSSILIFLLTHGTVNKTDIVSVVHSNTSVDKLVDKLNHEGFISVKKEFAGRNTYYISLTFKGRLIAEKLREAQEASEILSIHEDKEGDFNLELTDEEAEKAKQATMLFHFNVMDDHITIQENTPGKNSRIFNIYIKRNGNGDFRLWCEEDQTFECWHVRAAWTYPEVQHMMVNYKGKTQICPFCNTVNDIDATYCKHCGAKLE
ncbi:hypothetical protein [Ferroplasma sp.]|uniref:hypothetical protein n=1 Tax=Ferroplasma sp. TaxID=2591003 RepID=UPI002620635F|nr:hypothetical protein [Ferroplasma sp.]